MNEAWMVVPCGCSVVAVAHIMLKTTAFCFCLMIFILHCSGS